MNSDPVDIPPIPSLSRRVYGRTRDFFQMEAAGGIILVLAATLSLIIVNSPLDVFYNYIFNDLHFGIGFTDSKDHFMAVEKSLLHWVNDGLMAMFFLLVGLEIKRELLTGELSSFSKAALPVAAAIGGMVVPAGFYFLINQSYPEALAGWAIPCATDIAFALGVLSLLGSRVPITLKILLTAIAIIDDLGAIVIIAMFYTDNLHIYSLLFSILPIIGLFLLNRIGYVHRGAYIVLGIILWLAVLKSGVHATMAGVITALFIPVRVKDEARSPAMRLEHDLHPWVSFLILPLFAFANAGISFAGMSLSSLFQPVPFGIMTGLFLGKQIGVFGAGWVAVKSGLCRKPSDISWFQFYGLAVLCGIGFTMSLFIGGLAFPGADMQADLRLGVLAGSLFSAVAAYIFLYPTGGKAKNP